MTDFNPDLDLKIDKWIKASPETVWRCWEDPEMFKQWFCPKPHRVIEVDNHFVSGGRSFCIMKLDDGTEIPNEGCFLLVEPARRIVMSDAATAGFRPSAQPFMTADIRLTPRDNSTLYAAHVMHADAENRKKHEDMGFHDGWGTAISQLATLAETI